MNEKIQQLTFEKGITNIPSDAVCSDNELEECMGLYHDGAEHRPIQNPVLFMENLAGEVIFVHKLAGETHYIYKTPPVYEHMQYHFTLSWRLKDDATGHEIATLNIDSQDTYKGIQVTAIGKTLIVNVPGEDIKYFLWKSENGAYSPLGTLPEPVVKFQLGLLRDKGHLSGLYLYERSRMEIGEGWLTLATTSPSGSLGGGVEYVEIVDGHENDYNDAAVGLYWKNLEKINRNKGFSRPFMIRYALEMYDGSYTKISAPILMLPSITHNCYGHLRNAGKKLIITTIAHGLYYSTEYDYSEWSDIVKGVTVFASEGVEVQDVTGHEEGRLEKYDRSTEILPSIYELEFKKFHAPTINGDITEPSADFHPFTKRDAQSIVDDIESISIFYKIFELGNKVNTEGEYKRASALIKDNVLNNLTSQEQLTLDYYSHCPMSANYITTYNNRLLLAGVRRGFFEGFTSFMPYNQNDSYSAQEKPLVIVVYIKTDEGTRIVSKRFTTSDIIGKYFFYPDPRAYRAKIYTVTASTTDTYNLIKDMELKEHPFLNGAYYFEGLPDGTETMEGGTPAATIDNDVKTPEYLYNQVFNSEVNNPFVYRAEGNFTVGNGKVMALASLTQALSQGQFGQYPLIVFTDEGIYAASISNTGIVTAVHPMSREVLNNVDSVTQTDGAIFFSSEKGLMVVVGNEVKCVSEQLNGKSSAPLQTYLKTAYIAYDYRDSLLWIFNGSETCWIYSIKSGTFSHYTFQNASGSFVHTIGSVVNSYPDYLLQSDSDDAIYSLLERENINEGLDDISYDIYNCQIVTRPMKLENGLALKSIRQIRNIKQLVRDTYHMRRIDDYISVRKLQLRIFASNDLKNWTELSSLRGTPWKYFKFQYDFKKLHAADRFAGAVVYTQERRINKLR